MNERYNMYASLLVLVIILYLVYYQKPELVLKHRHLFELAGVVAAGATAYFAYGMMAKGKSSPSRYTMPPASAPYSYDRTV